MQRGQSGHFAQPGHALQILACGAAAAIAIAHGHDHVLHFAALPHLIVHFSQLPCHHLAIVSGGVIQQTGKHTGAVDALPPKHVVGELVHLIPVQFGGEKIVDLGFFQDLRQSP